ncbi:hypothetical protein FV139_18155 [Parahaliea maris]|uniref:DUF4760 domain-containing protein n=1 Tax=Parahaliea maris TaxID=2716870 RepID=A0A5C8ZNX3_9GAMM|nr:hypothetical protein [Parahaliea maris]TXS90188.1 hypothetical protein FV139_18155 [Parahaliea maris]
MDWEAIGAIAEVFGAVAVIATLAYLGVQVRQSNRLIDSSLAESHANAANEIARLLASDSTAATIFWEGLETDRENIAIEDLRRFDPMIMLFTMSAYQAHRQNDNDALMRADWILQFLGFKQWWRQYRNTYNQEFQNYIDSRLRRL